MTSPVSGYCLEGFHGDPSDQPKWEGRHCAEIECACWCHMDDGLPAVEIALRELRALTECQCDWYARAIYSWAGYRRKHVPGECWAGYREHVETLSAALVERNGSLR